MKTKELLLEESQLKINGGTGNEVDAVSDITGINEVDAVSDITSVKTRRNIELKNIESILRLTK